jgi:hypothetical protein
MDVTQKPALFGAKLRRGPLLHIRLCFAMTFSSPLFMWSQRE